MSIDKDTLLKTFTEYGFGPGSDPHSWRCYHPDRYGDCSCASDLADAVLALDIPAPRFSLTTDEADLVYPALIFAAERHEHFPGPAWQRLAVQLRAIAARLEEVSS